MKGKTDTEYQAYFSAFCYLLYLGHSGPGCFDNLQPQLRSPVGLPQQFWFLSPRSLYLSRFPSVFLRRRNSKCPRGRAVCKKLHLARWAAILIGIWLPWKLSGILEQLFSLFKSASRIEILVFSDFFLLSNSWSATELWKIHYDGYHLILFCYLSSP